MASGDGVGKGRGIYLEPTSRVANMSLIREGRQRP
jgi:hypothetical protein